MTTRMNQTTTTELQRFLASYERELNRRGLLRLAIGGTAGLAVAATGARAGIAQDASPAASPAATPLGAPGEVTIYSGRNEELVAPVIADCAEATDVDAEVLYGSTGELAATILEEGENSPASLYLAQDAGALGALAQAGVLAELPEELLNRVDPRFRSPDGLWVGVSGRARVLVYNTDLLSEDELPASVLDLTDPSWEGQVGWAPENASFQTFVTALRQLEGEDGARAWLEGMIANNPVVFEGNGPIVQAVAAGEIPVGLVNHYYKYEIEAEEGALPIENHFFAAGDAGALINVAGIAILASAPDPEQALAIADCLLREPAQTYFAEQTFEYPLIEGVEPAAALRPLAEIESPDLDLTDLDDLEGTVALLTDVGVL